MSDAHKDRASDRARMELIEADADMAFGLVDDARTEYPGGNPEFAQAALEDGNTVLMDIEDRLSKLDARYSAPFGPLVTVSRGASEGDPRRAVECA